MSNAKTVDSAGYDKLKIQIQINVLLTRVMERVKRVQFAVKYYCGWYACGYKNRQRPCE